ncbi:MAG: DNA repair protein RadC, partial [Methylococcaceae bacterium]
MSIKDWPADEQPREKLLARGSEALTDVELLAIFLRTGVAGKSAVDLARELLDQFGSLQALLDADQSMFCKGKGLGNAKFAQLQAVLEMAKRHFVEILQRGDALASPQVTRAYLSAQLRGYSYEVFACLFLDNQHRVILLEELFRGTIDSASIYPREVAKRALFHNAAAVIFAHNHPSGINKPSQADKQITETL